MPKKKQMLLLQIILKTTVKIPFDIYDKRRVNFMKF